MIEEGYYTRVSDGAISYMVQLNDEVEVITEDGTYTYSDNDINQLKSEYIKSTEMEYSDRLGVVIREISELNNQTLNINSKMAQFNPSIENNIVNTSTSLIPSSTMSGIKKSIADIRNNSELLKKNIALKQNKLKALLEIQESVMHRKSSQMKELISKLEESIWSINLYLGKYEEIHALKIGKPAPESQKISIRQGVLFMDEECAKLCSDGGIDIDSIELFDKWLLSDEKNLNSVLPETKGIIALKVRRSSKHYDDKFVAFVKDKPNTQWTYFLIRNGVNLYRVYIDINVGTRLFPDKDEYSSYFDEDLKPGSKKYLEDLKHAESNRKHYMLIALVLQGLMDRTEIFKPMPIDRINLSNPSHCNEWINLIYDKENTITDGKPLFFNWLRTVNEKLEVGNRIIAVFGYSSDMKERLYPVNSCTPESNVLHVINDKESRSNDTRYVFNFERKRDRVYRYDVWDGYDVSAPKTRGRCWVFKSDPFILNFDNAEIDELKYYLNHRLSRSSYQTMIPLLEAAIALKEEETAKEAPFKQLLVNELVKVYGIEIDQAVIEINDLVKWWKFKNKTHRALVEEDANYKSAIKMIINEYGIRKKQESIRNSISCRDHIVNQIMNQLVKPIMIAHKSDNKYVAYTPSNNGNTWVSEQLWVHNRLSNAVTLKEMKEWRTVDNRHKRWEIIYSDERWNEWVINPQISEILTDNEINELIPKIVEVIGNRIKNNKYSSKRYLPLCVYRGKTDKDIKFVYVNDFPKVGNDKKLKSRYEPTGSTTVKVIWQRTKEGIVIKECNHLYYNEFEEAIRKPIKTWDNNIAQYRKECAIVERRSKNHNRLFSQYFYLESIITKEMVNLFIEKMKKEYYSDFGLPELWNDHLKTLRNKIDRISPNNIRQVFALCVENDINPVGRKLGDLYKQFNIDIQDGLCCDFVLPAQEQKEEIDEDDDDFDDNEDEDDFDDDDE